MLCPVEWIDHLNHILHANEKFPKITNFSILAALLAAPFEATAQTTIYSDDFGGESSDNLLGTLTDAGDGTWGVSSGAPSAFKADGSVVTADSASGIWLPVTIEQGNVYTLSADVDLTGGHWISLGYAESNSSNQSTNTGGDGTATVKPNAVVNYAGRETVGGNLGAIGLGSGVIKLKIELDTTAAASVNWTMEFFESDVSISAASTANYGSYGNIEYVGFTTRDGDATGTIDNFSFTVITAVP
jgi:hypothetical protein